MTYQRAILTVPYTTNLPRDSITMSWAYKTKGGNTRTEAATAITTSVDNMLSTLGSYLADDYQWDQGSMEHFDMAEDTPRVPFTTQSVTPTGVSGSGVRLPSEVSLVCSLQGATGSGLNMRRRRGRFYLGPFSVASGTDQHRPTSTMLTAVASALDTFITSANYELCIYSRYTHHGVPVGENIGKKNPDGTFVYTEQLDLLDASFIPVVTAWVDDAWDTQRRRGVGATGRTVLDA